MDLNATAHARMVLWAKGYLKYRSDPYIHLTSHSLTVTLLISFRTTSLGSSNLNWHLRTSVGGKFI